MAVGKQGVHPFIGNTELILPNLLNTSVLAFIPRCFPSFEGEMFTGEALGVFLTGILWLVGWFSPLPKEISTFQEGAEAVLWGLELLRCQGGSLK